MNFECDEYEDEEDRYSSINPPRFNGKRVDPDIKVSANFNSYMIELLNEKQAILRSSRNY